MRCLKQILTVLATVALTALVGCASLGLASANTLQQKILYGYAGVTASLTTLAQATNAGLVSASEAETLNANILGVKGELDQAITLVCGTPPPANGEPASGYCASPTNAPGAPAIIATATAALTGISSYLACKQVKGVSCPLP